MTFEKACDNFLQVDSSAGEVINTLHLSSGEEWDCQVKRYVHVLLFPIGRRVDDNYCLQILNRDVLCTRRREWTLVSVLAAT